jgi:hypothetical protein
VPGYFVSATKFNDDPRESDHTLENASSRSGPSQKTLKRLFATSGNQCAFPNCRIEIVREGTILGEVCHIKSAKANGPRYDALQSEEERHGYGNLILLCANHHTVIDHDEQTYTVERQIAMKRDHQASGLPLSDDKANTAASLMMSLAQMGGIAVQTVNAGSIHIHSPIRANSEATAAVGRSADAALNMFIPELSWREYWLIRFTSSIVRSSTLSAHRPAHRGRTITGQPFDPGNR